MNKENIFRAIKCPYCNNEIFKKEKLPIWRCTICNSTYNALTDTYTLIGISYGESNKYKKLEEAKEILKTFKTRQKTINYNKIDLEDVSATETVLQALEKLQWEKEIYIKSIKSHKRTLENSIPKEVIEKKIEELTTQRIKFQSDNVNRIYLKEFTRKYTEKETKNYGVFNIPECITYCIDNENTARITVLQELLEGK